MKRHVHGDGSQIRLATADDLAAMGIVVVDGFAQVRRPRLTEWPEMSPHETDVPMPDYPMLTARRRAERYHSRRRAAEVHARRPPAAPEASPEPQRGPGRPRALSDVQVAEAAFMRAEGMTLAAIARHFEVTGPTIGASLKRAAEA